MRVSIVALAFLASLLAVPGAPRAAAQEDPYTLEVNPFKNALTGWERTGSDKAFTWNSADSTLTLKGQSGKDPPRLVYAKSPWEKGELRMQVKKGARKLRFVVAPPAPAKPVALELPASALKSTAWTDVAVRLGPGKATILSIGGDGTETEAAAAEIPAGAACRFGFEAPSGTDAVVTGVKLRWVYQDEPQVCEPGFESTFDGKSLAEWRPSREKDAPCFTVEKGLIVGTVRTEEDGWLVLSSRRVKSYELRMRALWSTTALVIRALEVPGQGGQINRFDTVQVAITDLLDPAGMNEIVSRVADGKCTVTINGKAVVDAKVKDADPAPISLFLPKGKRFFLRDIRIKDLSPGAAPAPSPPSSGAPARGGEGAPAAQAPGWKPKGGFAESEGVWQVAEAPAEGAGLVSLAADVSFYECRFKVGKGATALSVVPRANRGIERAPGVRLPEALFEKDDWTEVVLKMGVMTAHVLVAGEEVGTLEADTAIGPPGIRVGGGGSVRLKDLALVPLRK
jgi:hypothetical protein